MKAMEIQNDVRTAVREHYGKVAARPGCGCAPACCSPDGGGDQQSTEIVAHALGYSAEQTSAIPEGANLGLGCGNPLAIASLKAGQTVLDLGSGAGFDAFLAAQAVGPKGKVIGVDMTPEMIAKARRNQARGDYANVEFRLGEIENLPVADASVDVIISNCAINLSPDKAAVFREAGRVLKPGGRLAISDIVALRVIPGEVEQDMAAYSGCVGGAAPVSDLERLLAEVGLTDIRITPNPESRAFIQEWFPGRNFEEYVASATIEAVKPGAQQ